MVTPQPGSIPGHRTIYKRAAVKKYHKKILAAVRAEKNKPCKDCDVSYPHYVMDFDHVRGKKKIILSRTFVKSHGLAAILREIKKCDVVCSNCHRERTERRRVR